MMQGIYCSSQTLGVYLLLPLIEPGVGDSKFDPNQ